MTRRTCQVWTVVFVLGGAAIPDAEGQSLDQQAVCAAQARRAFEGWQREFQTAPASQYFKTVASDYQSHYNTKLGKCFVLVQASRLLAASSTLQNSAFLFDAYERRNYASYMSGTSNPMTCELTPSLARRSICKSEEEFNTFVASYME